jgi:hypothetical protein
MTSALTSLPLGFAPATGRASVSQAVKFKELLREALGSREPDGVFLETVVDGQRRGIQATFEDTPGAEQWATRALQASEAVWQDIAKSSPIGVVDVVRNGR